jgi:hypothetical protein
MVDIEATLADLVVDPDRTMVMRSVARPDGAVATAADTVAMIK